MNMLQRIAKQNRKYYRKRNLLIGIAIFLASLLIFVLLSIGVVFQQEQYASINAYYQNWQGWYKNIPKELTKKLASRQETGKWGLYTSKAFTELPKHKRVYYCYMTDNARDMLRLKLAEGHMPKAENEIVFSPEAARKLKKPVKVGESVTLSFQVLRDGKADYSQKKEFVISGLLEDTESPDANSFTALISEQFLKTEVPAEQISYEFLFRVSDKDASSTVQIENIIQNMAAEYQIPEDNVRINHYNLTANYTDPDMVMILSVIICIVVLAGIITIYSIYYVRMNERIQEFGKLKAIGMTKRELRHIVFKEGIGIAKKAAPLGILAGLFIEIIGLVILHAKSWNLLWELLPWISVPKLVISHIGAITLSLTITFLMVYLSLRKPMRIAGRITEIEAIRYPASHDSKKLRYLRKKSRKSRKRIHIFYLVKNQLRRYKLRSLLTILSMSATGMLAMVVATVISCTDPKLNADDLCHGQYMINEAVEFNNAEHPEREWDKVIQDNPLTGDLLQKIEEIEGVQAVTSFDSIYAEIPELSSGKYEIMGIPEENKSFLMDRITQGTVTYEALKSGERIVMDERAAKWTFHGLQIGDTISYVVDTGNGIPLVKKAEIVALGDFPMIFPGLFTASEALKELCPANANCRCVYSVWCDETYNAETEKHIKAAIEKEPLLMLHTWQEQYETEQSSIQGLTVLCCIFLGILGGICIMNLINTMISSVQQRKKEIGILQAVGMTDWQLFQMLQLEGGLYIFGTLFTTIIGGFLLSFPVFLWARNNGFLGIRSYQFPATAVCAIAIILIVLEILLASILSHTAKKETIIDRIRF